MTEAEVAAIQLRARSLSNTLSPLILPGTIAVERHNSDNTSSDFDPEKKVKFKTDDESSTASDSSADNPNDEEILDIEKLK